MTTTSTPATDEDQIRAVIADRAAAMHDRDAERFVAHYAPQVVKFDLPTPPAPEDQTTKPGTTRRAPPEWPEWPEWPPPVTPTQRPAPPR